MTNRILRARGATLTLGHRTLVMGVVNVTPDSFSDGGLFLDREAALAHAAALAAEGADILDIGGESTRPGHEAVAGDAEIARAIPVVAGVAASASAPVSIDTWKSAVADAALAAGAAIVNDVWGLQRDPDIARAAAAHGAAVVAMHNRDAADGGIDILADIEGFLRRSVDIALAAGIGEDQIVLDPGIGFGKTFEQNLTIIAHLPRIRAIGFPVLLGASRKSFIGRILDRPVPAERLSGSIAAHVAGALAGVEIVRVHDVAAHRDAVAVADAIRRAGA